MKILMVNKFHYIKGGSETYYFALKRMLEKHGHIVIDFSMKDDKNFTSPYESFFVDNVDYNNGKGILKKILVAQKLIYSVEAKNKFEQLIKQEKPDLIHLHIFQHQISPSILDVAKKYNIPVIYTAHDLKMVCLNYKMMHHGKICEMCNGERYYHCLKNKCVKESYLKSMINVIEGYVHKWRKTYDVIDVIITPSDFYKKKFEQFGVSSERIVHIPNFLERETPIVNHASKNRQYFLYFGRLSEEKGILTLIKAIANTQMHLCVVGTGPLEKEILSYIEKENISNVELLGYKSGQELIDIVGNAKAVVLPSEWYENGPYSAIEALQLGRPIIGADIGGIPEMIRGNGYLFESGNVEGLRDALEKINQMSDDDYQEMEQASIKLYKDTYTEKVHFDMMSRVYQRVGIEVN